jgi:hypothetical protein
VNQIVECLPSKRQALSLSQVLSKKKKFRFHHLNGLQVVRTQEYGILMNFNLRHNWEGKKIKVNLILREGKIIYCYFYASGWCGSPQGKLERAETQELCWQSRYVRLCRGWMGSGVNHQMSWAGWTAVQGKQGAEGERRCWCQGPTKWSKKLCLHWGCSSVVYRALHVQVPRVSPQHMHTHTHTHTHKVMFSYWHTVMHYIKTFGQQQIPHATVVPLLYKSLSDVVAILICVSTVYDVCMLITLSNNTFIRTWLFH